MQQMVYSSLGSNLSDLSKLVVFCSVCILPGYRTSVLQDDAAFHYELFIMSFVLFFFFFTNGNQ